MKANLRGAAFVVVITVILSGTLVLNPSPAKAHCDTMDGPVVKAAQSALDTGDINLVLLWVQKKDEPAIKKAFEQTLSVRKLNPEAKAMADMYFFESLVRIHRAGEGAPYTGVKPPGSDLGPAIPAADKAIEDGKAQPLMKLLTDAIHDGMHKRFKDVVAKKTFNKDDVEAGRDYVKAYVEFTHYIEGLNEAAKGPAHGHAHASEPVGESDKAHSH